MHDGVIGATSLGPGKGCTFFLEVPCSVANSSLSHTASFISTAEQLSPISPRYNAVYTSDEETPVQIGNILAGEEIGKSRDDSTMTEDTNTHQTHCSGQIEMENIKLRETESLLGMLRDVSGSEKVPSSPGGPNPPQDKIAGDAKASSALSDTNNRNLRVEIIEQRTATYERLVSSENQNKNTAGDHHQTTGSQSQKKKRSPTAADRIKAVKQNNTLLSELKVLLVDDSHIARKMVDRTLSAVGVTCYHANNGAEAVQMVGESMQSVEDGVRYDVILMDCYMPVMNGPEAVRAIRSSECGYTGLQFNVYFNKV